MLKHAFGSRGLCALALGMALGVAPSLGRAQEDPAEERIRRLEEQLRALTQELRSLKEQLREEQAAQVTQQPRLSPSSGTVDAATPTTSATRPAASVQSANLPAWRDPGSQRADLPQTPAQVEAAEPRRESHVPNVRLADGVIIEDPGGNWALRATARMQFDYRHFGDSNVLADTFSVRRARTGLGIALGGIFGAYVEGEFASGANTQGGVPSSSVLHQAYVDFNPTTWARLRAGQFKPQFGLENTMATWHHDFQERSLEFGLMQSFLFDRGVMVHGTPFAGGYYGLSVTNGTGTNIDEGQRTAPEAQADGKDVVLRLTGNAATWAELPDWVVHLGGNYRYGEVANGGGLGYTAPTAQTEVRGLVFFNPQPFNDATGTAGSETIRREIGGLEAALAYRSVKLQGEYFRASYAGQLPAPGTAFDRKIDTGYLQFNWLLTGELFADAYRNGIFGRIKPRNPFALGHESGWGALEAGLRYSFWDASDFTAGNLPFTGQLGPGVSTQAPRVTTSTNAARAFTLGLKWMPTAYVAYYLNYVRTTFDTPVTANGKALDREDAVVMRVQLDFF